MAAGLDPNNDPSTAQTYDVDFVSGLITVLDTYGEDSDDDGILDIDEDLNGNGIVDPGDTDPEYPVSEPT